MSEEVVAHDVCRNGYAHRVYGGSHVSPTPKVMPPRSTWKSITAIGTCYFSQGACFDRYQVTIHPFFDGVSRAPKDFTRDENLYSFQDLNVLLSNKSTAAAAGESKSDGCVTHVSLPPTSNDATHFLAHRPDQDGQLLHTVDTPPKGCWYRRPLLMLHVEMTYRGADGADCIFVCYMKPRTWTGTCTDESHSYGEQLDNLSEIPVVGASSLDAAKALAAASRARLDLERAEYRRTWIQRSLVAVGAAAATVAVVRWVNWMRK